MKNKRWYWLTERAKFDDVSAHHGFDILRYDGARVESNAPDGFYLFSTDAERHPRGPEVRRLASHGAGPDWVSERPCDPDYGQSKAWEWFHAHGRKPNA